jgi:hypothetical protein
MGQSVSGQSVNVYSGQKIKIGLPDTWLSHDLRNGVIRAIQSVVAHSLDSIRQYLVIKTNKTKYCQSDESPLHPSGSKPADLTPPR